MEDAARSTLIKTIIPQSLGHCYVALSQPLSLPNDETCDHIIASRYWEALKYNSKVAERFPKLFQEGFTTSDSIVFMFWQGLDCPRDYEMHFMASGTGDLFLAIETNFERRDNLRYGNQTQYCESETPPFEWEKIKDRADDFLTIIARNRRQTLPTSHVLMQPLSKDFRVEIRRNPGGEGGRNL